MMQGSMQTSEAVSIAPRNVWIDCLRGLCIFSVLCTHQLFKNPATDSTKNWFFSVILDNGYYGVATFFVISGFLITSNTLRRYGKPAKINFGQFCAMRVARILPCLLLFIAIMIPLGYAGFSDFTTADKHLLWGSAYATLTFQYNSYYLIANAPGLHHWAPLWSLSIEELFYLVFPLVCFLTRRRAMLAILLVGLIIGGPFARGDYGDLFSFWGAADLLSIGCLAAITTAHYQTRLTSLRWPLLVAGSTIILCVFGCCHTRINYTLTPTVLGFGTALFLMGAAAVNSIHRPHIIVAPLAALGRVSYEIYIFHVALIIALKPVGLTWLGKSGAPEALTYLATSVAVLALIYGFGYALNRFVTEPLNVKIRRFYAE
jgi:peptidoglycan/LPS O-acetylase OafA/YrhL